MISIDRFQADSNLQMAASGILSVLIILFSGVPQAPSRMIPDVLMIERHEQWMASYGREYKDPAEKEERYKVFQANVEYIDLVNGAGNKAYKLGVNEFADLTNEEFRASHVGSRNLPKKTNSRTTGLRYENADSIPPSIDWRQKRAVTPIRKATCGDWTFPAVDSVEGLTKIKTGRLYSLSVQEILDCDEGSNGCGGGFTEEAFEFIKHHGLTTSNNYPYNGSLGTCDTSKEKEPVAKISGYEKVPANDEKALLEAVAFQPVAAAVDAADVDFQFYSSGIFTGKCGTEVDHGVTLVGYGTDNDELKYWIIKNSWGTS